MMAESRPFPLVVWGPLLLRTSTGRNSLAMAAALRYSESLRGSNGASRTCSRPKESAMKDLTPGWHAFIGQSVVIDMAAPYVYVGRLVGERSGYLDLEDADAHDLRDTTTTRERYILDCREHGVRPNRRRVLVDAKQMVAISLL